MQTLTLESHVSRVEGTTRTDSNGGRNLGMPPRSRPQAVVPVVIVAGAYIDQGELNRYDPLRITVYSGRYIAVYGHGAGFQHCAVCDFPAHLTLDDMP